MVAASADELVGNWAGSTGCHWVDLWADWSAADWVVHSADLWDMQLVVDSVDRSAVTRAD